MILRTNPATVRLALAYAEKRGIPAAAIHYGVTNTTVYKWAAARERFGPDWPTLDQDREWLAKQPQRQRKRTQLASYRKRRYSNGGRPVMVPSHGTQRRIKALMRLGWPSDVLALFTPWSTGEAVLQLLIRPRCFPETAAIIEQLYDWLSMTPGPSTASALRAERAGYWPPLAWDDIDDPDEQPGRVDVDELLVDDVKVARVLAGEVLPCTRAERDVIVDQVRRDPHRSLRELELRTGWRSERYGLAEAAS